MASKWFGVGAFFVIAAGSTSALASVFYGVNTNGVVSRFDMAAHTVTPLSTIHAGPTTPTGFQDLEFDGAGNLYALRAYTDFNTFQSFNEIYRVTNPTTGNALLSGTIGSGGMPFQSLAYRSSNSSFYSVNAVNGQVCTVETNGAFSPVSGAAHGPRNLVHAMAINPVDGVAYSLLDMGIAIFGTMDVTLFRTDLATGISTQVGSLNVTTDAFTSLRIDENGIAYTVSNFGGDIYTVDLNTGAASFLFAGGNAAKNTNGLALISVPSPAGLGVLLAGVGMVATRRRR